jgi:hypothetical protein
MNKKEKILKNEVLDALEILDTMFAVARVSTQITFSKEASERSLKVLRKLIARFKDAEITLGE